MLPSVSIARAMWPYLVLVSYYRDQRRARLAELVCTFTCGACGEKIQCRGDQVGQRLLCPGCQGHCTCPRDAKRELRQPGGQGLGTWANALRQEAERRRRRPGAR